jgi:hypothetical protein
MAAVKHLSGLAMKLLFILMRVRSDRNGCELCGEDGEVIYIAAP